MEIDVNRVHDVLSGKLEGRGIGKTYAQICLVAGEIHVGNFDEMHIFTGRKSIGWSTDFTSAVLSKLGIRTVSLRGSVLICEYENRYVRLIFHTKIDRYYTFDGRNRNAPLYSLAGQ